MGDMAVGRRAVGGGVGPRGLRDARLVRMAPRAAAQRGQPGQPDPPAAALARFAGASRPPPPPAPPDRGHRAAPGRAQRRRGRRGRDQSPLDRAGRGDRAPRRRPRLRSPGGVARTGTRRAPPSGRRSRVTSSSWSATPTGWPRRLGRGHPRALESMDAALRRISDYLTARRGVGRPGPHRPRRRSGRDGLMARPADRG